MKRLILALLLVFSAAQLPAATPFPEAVSTSTTTLTLQPTVGVYTFTGSSPATWTLPAVSGNKDRQIIVKNRGSATITLQRAGSDQLYTTTTATSTTVTAGGWAKLVNDGVYWAVLTAGSGGLASTDIDTSAELATILTDETGSGGAAVFASGPTLTGTTSSGKFAATATYVASEAQFYNSNYGSNHGLQIDSANDVNAVQSNNVIGSFATNYGLRLHGSYPFGFVNGGANSAAADVTLYRDAANVLALRNSTSAQNFRIYNTDSGANDEYLNIGYTSNVAKIDSTQTGTGTQRDLTLTAPTITLSGNVSVAGNVVTTAGSNRLFTVNRNALTDYGRFMVQQNGTDKWGIGSRGDEAANNMLIFRDETNGSNVLSLYQGASGASQVATIGSVQNQQAQKTLTKASATAFVQVAVPSNGYVGGIVHYTLISSDGTDYQSRGGSVPFSAVNKGGTETCNFGTPSDTSAVSAGTITITGFDADTSPTNAVNLRCNATTSFASPSTFALRYWVEISGSPVPVTPQ